ncbi:thimet oligopeptidase-like [Neophocaena asiaeorientalis asiaeorientalis]|uniref:Thimet oligopeptidase n=1 Tax=Neophocaena asiaeorientalis asiaeorientalis TaxID=1706337 RepID=A0A341CGW5_NEOAA|nr:thimet oligopeptidase-like [Neophocaena asiaeorientalis asiaeorientalis]
MRTRGKALGPGAPCPVRPWRCCQSWWGTGSTVPQELLDKLIKAREANPDAAGPREGQGASGLPVWKARPGHGASPPSPSSRPPGLFNLCQIVLAKVVQALHTQMPADPAQENARFCQEILGCPAMPGSYDAQFYGYLCSKVYSADTFHTHFKQERSLSGKAAMDYRSCILRPGGSEDAKGRHDGLK